MKKESFTFSDKLKKSKTLPLSKRIPSRIGGEVKAKRTLFERAQRDLPFIIVAALALLLLPFLSRESVDEMPSVVWPGSEVTDSGDPVVPTYATGELPSAGLVDPLSHIIRTGEADGKAVRDTLDREEEDDEGYGTRSGSGSAVTTARSRSEETDYYGGDRSGTNTGRYKKVTNRSTRSFLKREPTAKGTLAKSSLARADGGGGFRHDLAFGNKPQTEAQKSPREGIRPVALQPLTAKGGRDLTGGDALYAEAARSIGAFNRPGAKQALLEAQMKDVDGQPLGETKGGGGPGDPNRPGANGNLGNTWSHNSLKPWWWDMMNDRAQKRWMLWHYNWEEMLSKNLLTWTSGMLSCLGVGSADGSVGKFFGDSGGDPDFCCDFLNT